ncbi:hypothetical protein [Petrotoga sp. 9PWA.NaAc.5.4]|uniref:hypothetical protein n=1 Tax=Petrotoga sp. 9PWA.NaAc.5.4 TaxID=1434328 RepID=UPI000CBFCAFE|nr:hypothetical protein [Petrotoga sp. 9PWA.NaAc.5.4]PNR94347.1 hypothetical protein X924_06745 [Petrotoga sp. 9PWA.NaAc.5.4]
MDILKDLENMLETLVDKYNELKKEKSDLQSQYNELFNEYERTNNEKEDLSRQLEELKRKNEEVENYLSQMRATLISRLGEEFAQNNDSSEFSNYPDQGDSNQSSY